MPDSNRQRIGAIRHGDLTGRKFNLLTVLRQVGSYCECVCDCGNETTKHRKDILTDRSKSCGCRRFEAGRLSSWKHGDARKAARPGEYRVWQHMIGRCHNPTDRSYKHYGARGIFVCDEWRADYERFLSDMGRRPTAIHSIERKDNDGPYHPDNCVWATKKEQGRNRRSTRWIEHFGQRVKLIELAEQIGISFNTLRFRYEAGDRDGRLVRAIEVATHCKRGHEFEEGSFRINVNGSRECKICERLRYRANADKRGVVARKAVADWRLPSNDSLITRRSA